MFWMPHWVACCGTHWSYPVPRLSNGLRSGTPWFDPIAFFVFVVHFVFFFLSLAKLVPNILQWMPTWICQCNQSTRSMHRMYKRSFCRIQSHGQLFRMPSWIQRSFSEFILLSSMQRWSIHRTCWWTRLSKLCGRQENIDVCTDCLVRFGRFWAVFI